MATGMLKFSPNNTVYIDLDLDAHTANKAVDIDAEGREWPLCGGGSGDFEVLQATITYNGEFGAGAVLTYYGGQTCSISISPNTTDIYDLIAYQGRVAILGRETEFTNISGAAEFVDDADGQGRGGLLITGACSFTFVPEFD